MSSIAIDLAATGRNIEARRKAGDFTVQELSGLLYCTPQAVSKWINGRCAPSLDSLVMMSDVFHCSIDDIIVRVGKSGSGGLRCSNYKEEGGGALSSPVTSMLDRIYGFVRSVFMPGQ